MGTSGTHDTRTTLLFGGKEGPLAMSDILESWKQLVQESVAHQEATGDDGTIKLLA